MVMVAGVGTALAGFGASSVLDSTSTYSGGTNTNVSGVDLTGTNHLTGPYSLNKNKFYIKHKVDVDIYNKNYEKNDLDFLFNTGKNDTKKNTKVGDVSTGNIKAGITLINDSNSGLCHGCKDDKKEDDKSGHVLSAADPSFDFSNSLTGPDSVNINKAKVTDKTDIDIKNKAYIKNDIDVKANTGKNEVEKNTVVGNVSTGDITLTGSVENIANANQCITCKDIAGLLSGSSSPAVSANFANDITGPYSLNKNKLDLEHKVDVDVTNKAYIKNDIDVKANTGKNEVEKNTVVGNVSTGDIMVDFSVLNKAN